MKNELVKKALPHVVAVLIFLLVSVLFCKPALEGNVLDQHDIVGWKGMAQDAFDYKEKNGHFPLWNTHLFSGMPNYLIAMEGKSVLPDLSKVLALGLPQPMNFFFLASLCFYLLCLALGARPVVAIFGALAYAFATYNPIIIAAGHVTKMFAIAYMPLLLAGLLLTYNKKYWLGLAVSTLGAYLLLGANHPQISYYFFLVAAAVTLSYVFVWIKNKEWKHLALSAGIVGIAAIVAILTTSLSLLTTTEYSKATMRGGKSVEIAGDSVKNVKTTGLDTSYAFSYSLGKGEALTLLMPNSFGGSTRQVFGESSGLISKMTAKGIPENVASQLAEGFPRFWGDPSSTGGGPLYAGVIVCLLALMGFVLYKHPLRWGLLAISVIAIMMALGKYLPGFNIFLYNNLPLYSKFRAPSITMVIPQLVVPVMAVLGLQTILFRENAQAALQADFRKLLYAVGGLLALLLICYLMMDYGSLIDQSITGNLKNAGADDNFIRNAINAMKEERRSIFGMQILRTVGFMILVLGLLWLYLKNILKPVVVAVIFTAITFIDQLIVDKDYLNAENYKPKDEMESHLTVKNNIDNQILADKEPQFRVYYAGQDRFMATDYHTSTFHRSIGGYHPAKLRIYQDIIERYLYGGDARQVLNMLNVKYIIAPNPQNGQETLIPNPEAYGPCWLVKNVKLVSDAATELQTIGHTDLKDTAVVQAANAPNLVQPQWDSTASISLVKYDNDEIEYSFNASTPQFAVFSEVYYDMGWNVYVDGQKSSYVKTNYALRGMSLPAGKHSIKFVFEPESVKKGTSLSFIGSILVLLLTLGGLFMNWRQSRQTQQA
ncbi:MAG: YfhO family protein [Sphingobacteriales bacterium]|nr:YfhO family protein [Sphingobacteriales bacterium]OJW34880.1 MAG: hypothetical protein BGO54_06220 [Sphingobacteriales bacterium 46-32]